jgi:hypothetical protein
MADHPEFRSNVKANAALLFRRCRNLPLTQH